MTYIILIVGIPVVIGFAVSLYQLHRQVCKTIDVLRRSTVKLEQLVDEDKNILADLDFLLGRDTIYDDSSDVLDHQDVLDAEEAYKEWSEALPKGEYDAEGKA
jgi:hypothetical protein